MQQETSTFDEFLQTPIMGKKAHVEEVHEGGDVEEGIKVSVASHQAVSRGGGGTPTASSQEATSGGGESKELQPQVVFGYCLLQGLRDNPMEDLHLAEIRDVDGREVGVLLRWMFVS